MTDNIYDDLTPEEWAQMEEDYKSDSIINDYLQTFTIHVPPESEESIPNRESPATVEARDEEMKKLEESLESYKKWRQQTIKK